LPVEIVIVSEIGSVGDSPTVRRLDNSALPPDHPPYEEQSMIGSLGAPELLFILVLALLVFGPRKLPEIGRTLGRALGEFRRATSDLKRTLDVELSSEELNKPPAPAVTARSLPKDEAAAPAPSPAAQDSPASAEAEGSAPPGASEAKDKTE